MSVLSPLPPGTASRLIGRHTLNWAVAAALGAGSGYYAGRGGLEASPGVAARPAAAGPAMPSPAPATAVPTRDWLVEDLPPTF